MARESMITDPRIFRLMRALKISWLHAIGIYEGLHLLAYASGSYRYANKNDLEALAQWPGKPNSLADALLESKLVNHHKGHTLELTNFLDECPDYIYKRHGSPPAPNRAVSRGSARNGAEPPDPDPIRSPDRNQMDINPRSRSTSGAESGSTVRTPQGPEGTGSKSPRNAPEAAGTLAERQLEVLTRGKSLQSPLEARPDYGALSQNELVARYAAFETRNPPDVAKKLWAARFRELEQIKGGLEFSKKLLSYVDANQAPGRPKSETKITHVPRYLNDNTRRFVRAAQEKKAS